MSPRSVRRPVRPKGPPHRPRPRPGRPQGFRPPKRKKPKRKIFTTSRFVPYRGVALSPTDCLSVRIGLLFPSGANPAGEPLDFLLSLGDGAEVATVRAGAIATVAFPDTRAATFNRKVMCPMATVRIPIDAFVAANPALSLVAVRLVALTFASGPAGDVTIDDVEFASD